MQRRKYAFPSCWAISRADALFRAGDRNERTCLLMLVERGVLVGANCSTMNQFGLAMAGTAPTTLADDPVSGGLGKNGKE
jgi:hypothetical protein